MSFTQTSKNSVMIFRNSYQGYFLFLPQATLFSESAGSLAISIHYLGCRITTEVLFTQRQNRGAVATGSDERDFRSTRTLHSSWMVAPVGPGRYRSSVLTLIRELHQ
jgi:hypothetical protein